MDFSILRVLGAEVVTTGVAGGNWLWVLFTTPSVAHAVLVFAMVIALGIAVGSVRVGGVSLGIVGVLFSGIGFAHFGFKIEASILEFVREFGLILFVYTIGLQVGPGFLGSLRRAGLPLNLMAAGVVLLGVAMTVGVVVVSKAAGRPITVPTAVGLLSGGTTNTPSLAAAQQAVMEVAAARGSGAEVGKLPGLGYAVAYPFGVVGIILSMLVVRQVFRVNVVRENEELARKAGTGARLENRNLEVTNPNMVGKRLGDIPQLTEGGTVVSRVMQNGSASVAFPEHAIQLGDVLHVVGTREQLGKLEILVGHPSKVDVRAMPSDIATKRLVATRREVIGKTLRELDLVEKYGVTVTRTSRADIEIAATPEWRVQFGDVLLAVGSEEALTWVAEEMGDSLKKLEQPHVIPLFVGIALGVIVGSVPLSIPGIPAAVRLGLAGGPLLVAIVLSRVGQIGPLSWYMPRPANSALRELGIVLFLACVGLKAGDQFMATLTHGDGLYWMGCAALITLVPLLVMGVIGRVWGKMNYVTLCGVLAGSMTDPPALQFANQMTGGEAPSVAYATVYPMTMLLRVVTAQMLVLMMWGG